MLAVMPGMGIALIAATLSGTRPGIDWKLVAFGSLVVAVGALEWRRTPGLGVGALLLSDDDDWADPEDMPLPVPPLRLTVLFSVAVLSAGVFAALGYVALELVPNWIASGGDHPPPNTAQSLALERGNLRTAGLGLVAAFGAGLGLLMTLHGHRYQTQEAARVERDRARNRRHARQSLTFERFNDAIKQLAEQDILRSDPTKSRALDPITRVTVRLAGVYSLGSVAMESPQQRPAVRDVLTAFVAEHQARHRDLEQAFADRDCEPHSAEWDQESAAFLADLRETAAPADVAAALVVLARIYGQDPRLSPPRLALAYSNLAGADLRSADLTDADLRGADLTAAKLFGATLQRATVVGANFARADLRGADLQGAIGMGSATFTGAQVEGVVLNRGFAHRVAADDDPATPLGPKHAV